MLDREKPDLAVVAPFFHLQSAVARECLRARHPRVRREADGHQPRGPRSACARRTRRAAAKLCPMLAYRYHPEFQAAWLAVKEGLVGEPLAALGAEVLQARHAPPDVHPARRPTAAPSRGWPIHAIDWLWWFTGGGLVEVSPRTPRRATGATRSWRARAPASTGWRTEAAASVELRLLPSRRPPPATATTGCAWPGERGVVEVMNGEAVLATHDAAPRQLEREEPRSIFLEFVRHIETGSPMRSRPRRPSR